METVQTGREFNVLHLYSIKCRTEAQSRYFRVCLCTTFNLCGTKWKFGGFFLDKGHFHLIKVCLKFSLQGLINISFFDGKDKGVYT